MKNQKAKSVSFAAPVRVVVRGTKGRVLDHINAEQVDELVFNTNFVIIKSEGQTHFVPISLAKVIMLADTQE